MKFAQKILQLLFFFFQPIIAEYSNLFYSAFTSNSFTTSEGWNIMNFQPLIAYSDCGNVRLLGGFNLFGTKVSVMKMFLLPPHYKIQVKLQFWKIDTWNSEYFYMYLDQNLVYKQQFQYDSNSLCGGGSWGDTQNSIDVTLLHSWQSINIYFTSNLDSSPNEESWGIRDLYFYLYLCPPGCLICEQNDLIAQCISWVLLNSAFLSIIQSQFICDGWLINGLTQQSTLCENIPIFGGYQTIGQNSIIQTTIDLPIHSLLKIQIRIAFIDSWLNEYLYIDIDNQRVISQQYSSSNGYGILNFCGNGNQADSFQNFQFHFYHTQSKISIKIYTNLDEDTATESFGIRDFQLFSFYQSYCGNNLKEENEECDDGNLEPFDGCFMCQYSCIEGCQNCLYGQCLYMQEVLEILPLALNIFNNNIIFQCKDDNLVPFDGCFNYQFSCLERCQNCIYGDCFDIIKFQQNTKQQENQLYENLLFECQDDNLVPFDGCFDQQYSCPESCSICVKGNCLQCSLNWVLYQNQCIPYCLNFYEDENYSTIQKQLKKFVTKSCLNCICNVEQQFQTYDECYLNCKNNLLCMECNKQCNQYCQVCQNGICLICIYAYSLFDNYCLPYCGDGLIAKPFEQCDDMNEIPYDGCFECQYQCDVDCFECLDEVCQVQCAVGYQYTNNQCIPICGDGIIVDLEECEENLVNTQNCKDCKFVCPQNCFDCEQGICQICNSDYQLDHKLNICINLSNSNFLQINNFDFDWCYDLCNDQQNNLCQLCKLLSQPQVILTYLGQSKNQQSILLSFSQKVKLQYHINFVDYLNLQIIPDVDSSNYQIIVKVICNANNNQVNNVQYQVEIIFNSSLNEFHYLKVGVETIILNEYNIELASCEAQILLLPYMQSSQNLMTNALLGKKINQVLIGSIGLQAIVALILGQQQIFLNLIEMLQFQSYLKFININFPPNVMIYFESYDIFQINYLLDLLNTQKLTNLVQIYRFQISYEKFEYYDINSDLLSNFEGQIFQIFFLVISLLIINIFQKILEQYFKLPSNNNIRVLRLLFLLQKYSFRFIKCYNIKNLCVALRANSWDLLFVAILQVSTAQDITFRNYVQNTFGYFIIFVYVSLCLSGFIVDKFQVHLSSKQFWRVKHQTVVLFQKLTFLTILIQLQFHSVLQILLLSTVQIIHLVYIIIIQPFDNKLDLFSSIQFEISILIFALSSILYCDFLTSVLDFERQIIMGWCQISFFLSVLIIRLIIEIKKYKIITQLQQFFQRKRQLEANPHPLGNKS